MLLVYTHSWFGKHIMNSWFFYVRRHSDFSMLPAYRTGVVFFDLHKSAILHFWPTPNPRQIRYTTHRGPHFLLDLSWSKGRFMDVQNLINCINRNIIIVYIYRREMPQLATKKVKIEDEGALLALQPKSLVSLWIYL